MSPAPRQHTPGPWHLNPRGWVVQSTGDIVTRLECSNNKDWDASLIAAALHAWRLWLWHPLVTFKRPILWILHASYAWMPIGFVLLALAQLGWIGQTLAVHAFAVGVIGGLIIGMLTRTASFINIACWCFRQHGFGAKTNLEDI